METSQVAIVIVQDKEAGGLNQGLQAGGGIFILSNYLVPMLGIESGV